MRREWDPANDRKRALGRMFPGGGPRSRACFPAEPGRTACCREKLRAALALTDDLISQAKMAATGPAGNTLMKILAVAGERCEKVMGRLIVNVPVKDVQADEIRGFILCRYAEMSETVAFGAEAGSATKIRKFYR